MMGLYSRFSGFTFVLIFCVQCDFTLAKDRIRIKDVQVVTLYNGKMTNGRRSSPVPQLKCTGGSAGCYAFTPNVVQCYNRGWDGYDVQWECKTEMDNKYKFGRIQVSCEGYEYPDDPYILRGSCGLEYTIDLTEEGSESKRSSGHDSWNSYHQGGNTYNSQRGSKSVYGFGDLVMLVIVGAIIYMIYFTCTGNRHRDTSATPPPYPPQPNVGRDYSQGPDTPPPPYSPSCPDEPGFKSEYTQGSAPPPPEEPGFRREDTQGAAGTTGAADSSGTSNSGFWTGAATGGLLGYLFGGRSSGNSYYRHNPGGGWGSPYNSDPYYRDTGRGWFGNWFGGGRSYGHRPSHHSFGSSSFGSSRSSSSGSRSASGMGGTSRR